ncbi:MAG: toxin-antitoxin system YwqK family antitoxin [Bacteroidetes bacterium]|nr:toxin-antitoxin system YwqK family antitoxin [Bacteroidota bacterium]
MLKKVNLLIIKWLSSILVFLSIGIISYDCPAQFGTDGFQTDNRGRKQGFGKKYDKGVLKYQGTFINDKPIGEFRYFSPDGQVKAITIFSDSGRVGRTISFYPGNRKMAEGKYVNEQKDSIWRYYSENGMLSSMIGYKDGQKNGLSTTYYTNGKPDEEITFADGVKHGTWIQYFESGQQRMKAVYVNGKLDGMMQTFHDNGRIRMAGVYKQSLKEGVWVLYDENGKILKKETYRNGDKVKEEYLDLQYKQQEQQSDSVK